MSIKVSDASFLSLNIEIRFKNRTTSHGILGFLVACNFSSSNSSSEIDLEK